MKINEIILVAVVILTELLVAHSTPLVYVNAEGGAVDYNMGKTEKEQGRGWYAEPGSPDKKFSLGFKQAERGSGNPKQVAFIQTTEAEHFKGKSALELKIIANDPLKPGSTASYKVSFDISSGGQVLVGQPKDWYNSFAMKIDPENFILPTTTPVLFEQWWQGSPYHPPVTMVILNPDQALKKGFTDIGSKGNFAIELRDIEHNPGGSKDKGEARVYNLGPVVTGEWIEWIVGVRPDPSGKDGAVTVWKNGAKKLELRPTVVGFSLEPGKKIGSNDMWVNLCIYRGPGQNSQRIFFDEIKLTDTLDDVLSH